MLCSRSKELQSTPGTLLQERRLYISRRFTKRCKVMMLESRLAKLVEFFRGELVDDGSPLPAAWRKWTCSAYTSRCYFYIKSSSWIHGNINSQMALFDFIRDATTVTQIWGLRSQTSQPAQTWSVRQAGLAWYFDLVAGNGLAGAG